MTRPLAYISAPWGDDNLKNATAAAGYCRQVYDAGYSPICPALFMPAFLKGDAPAEVKDRKEMSDELLKRSAASANIAQLIFQANITTLKMSDFGELLGTGTEEQRRNLEQAMGLENRFRTSFGIQLLSKDDCLENHAYSFAGLSEIYEQFMMDMAGAAEIPATRLFGRSPQGMNATGESDLKNYYDMIASLQERLLRPALEKLLPVMAVSCWGYVPENLEIVFEPVMTSSPAERAELVQKLSADVIEGFKCGLFTREEAIAELKARGEEMGTYKTINN